MIIRNKKTLAGIITELKAMNKKIVFTNGCFDILHAGHIDILKYAKSLGDILVVGVNTDDSVKRLKGPTRPIISLDNRMDTLDSIKYVDIIIPFSEDTPIELIKIVKPDVHIKGGDYGIEDLPERGIVENNGGKIDLFNPKRDISTSKIISKIRGESQ